MTQPAPSPPQRLALPRIWQNKHSGPCKGPGCETFVDRLAGIVVVTQVANPSGAPRNINTILCPACARSQGYRVPDSSHITMSLYGTQYVQVRVNRFLGGNNFEAYKAATDAVGVRWVGSSPVHSASSTPDKGDARGGGGAVMTLVHRDKAFELACKFGEAGLEVKLDEGVQVAFEVAERRKVLDVESAGARIETIHDKLAKRGLKLYPFQVEGVAWLAPRSCALLCDQMGLGKTVQALVALPSANKKSLDAAERVASSALVVCKNVGKAVWQREAMVWRQDFRPIVLSGRDSFRWPDPGEIVIMNYDILPEVQDLKPPPAGLVLIGDEGHSVKNPKAQRTIRFRAMGDMVRNSNGRTWILTGTPLMNRLAELWAMAQAAGCGNEAFGTYKAFKEMCGCTEDFLPCPDCSHPVKHSKGKGCLASIGRGPDKKKCGCQSENKVKTVWGQPSAEVSERFARIALRRRRVDVLPDLPGKSYEDHPVELKAEVAREVDAQLAPGWEEALEQALLEKGGVAFKEMSSARRALAEAKIGAALSLAEEFMAEDEPLVVFSCHTAPLEALGALEGWAVLDGSVTEKKRAASVEDFQAGKLRGLACNVTVAGTSITLTRASHALFVDQPWNPGDCDQCEDRLARIGQKRGVMIHRLIADHALDRRVTELLDQKRKMIQAALEGTGEGLAGAEGSP